VDIWKGVDVCFKVPLLWKCLKCSWIKAVLSFENSF
jgi:hypothetical protein